VRRRLTPERMDDPGLDAGEHARALAGLARLNRLSRSAGALWPSVAGAARARGGRASVLDIATGSADVPVALARRAARAGIVLDLHACDVSAVALRAGERRAGRAGVEIRLFVHDAVAAPFGGRYDVVTCSLFMHHLDASGAAALLRHAAQAGDVVLVSDLRRCVPGLCAAWLASRLLTRSRVVHTDAVKSVRAAWTPDEALALASDAGLEGARVVRRWPWRMLLSWRRP
jgi:2-polyprenyl-3-methyl-5-hydroxy-6-metoxy-1,4-benzoquinol methylase